MTDAYVNYIVIGLAMLFEGVGWCFAFRAVRASKGERGYLEAVRRSKDPTVFTVLFEDSAALLGLVVALAGIALGEWLEMPALRWHRLDRHRADPGRHRRLARLRVQEPPDRRGRAAARSAAASSDRRRAAGDPRVNEHRSVHLGPEEVLLNLSLDFAERPHGRPGRGRDQPISSGASSRAYPEIRRVFIEAQSWRGHRAALAEG